MKRVLFAAVGLVIALGANASAVGANGSAFGNMTTATTLGQGVGNFGGGVGIADATSAFATFTYGLSKYTDGRLKLGLLNEFSTTRLTFGADFKWQFWTAGAGRREPFDMAFGGAFEYVDLHGYSVFQIGGNIIGSYPFRMGNGSTLSPYGRFNIRVEAASGTNVSSSNLDFGLNTGVAWAATKTVTFYGELQYRRQQWGFPRS